MGRPLLLPLLLLAIGCSTRSSRSLELYNHGSAELRQKHYEAALSDFEAAIASDPTNQPARYSIGLVYKEQQRWLDALAAFEGALRHRPGDASLEREIAAVRAELKKMNDATVAAQQPAAPGNEATRQIAAQLANVPDGFNRLGSDAPVGLGDLSTLGHGGGRQHLGGASDVRMAAPEVVGDLDRGIVTRIIQRHRNELKYCYELELAKQPGLHGRVVLRFVISAGGEVTASAVQSSTTNNAGLDGCVVSAARRWQFPKGAGVVVVSYPFTFEPAP